MNCYSIPDLLRLLRTERGERVQLDAGYAPKLVVKGESHEIEGPAVEEESVEEMLRAVASTSRLLQNGVISARRDFHCGEID